DLGNFLAYISVGDRQRDIERLVSALAEIRRRYGKKSTGMAHREYIEPIVKATPQEAFYAESETLPIEETSGRVCSEFVMCYPPGIPILTPGELITNEILDYIKYAKEKGCSLTGSEDPDVNNLNVIV
ncbi:MAG: arginine decarboxylase, partial [Clostridia bacterium]|nr:arginine decarboxylase [Clostridia bacterium]